MTGKSQDHFWIVDREFDHRTSLIVDPPDGKVPALTPDAAKREAERAEYRRAHPYDTPEDSPLSERCVLRGVPLINAGYNSYDSIYEFACHEGHEAMSGTLAGSRALESAAAEAAKKGSR